MPESIYWVAVPNDMPPEEIKEIADQLAERTPEWMNAIVTAREIEPMDKAELVDMLETMLEEIKDE